MNAFSSRFSSTGDTPSSEASASSSGVGSILTLSASVRLNHKTNSLEPSEAGDEGGALGDVCGETGGEGGGGRSCIEEEDSGPDGCQVTE